MNYLEKKLTALNHIYRVYEEFTENLNAACKRGCARCCTCNVTLTTLEAYNIAEHIKHNQDLLHHLNNAPKKRFWPQITTNELAARCIQGQNIPEEESNPLWGQCPFLENKECLIYKIRPFGCRCMTSTQDCQKNGYADMPAFTLTVNNVFLQYIEHIDADGYYGNLTDILLFIISQSQSSEPSSHRLLHNQPVRMLMVPPEHQTKIKPLLNTLNKENFA